MSSKRMIPNGSCWCGCGTSIAVGKFFMPGHDKIAESGVILAEYGGIPEFLDAHGYGPGGKKSPRDAHQASREPVPTELAAGDLVAYVVTEAKASGERGVWFGNVADLMNRVKFTTQTNYNRMSTQEIRDVVTFLEDEKHVTIKWDFPDRKFANGGFTLLPTTKGRIFGERAQQSR